MLVTRRTCAFGFNKTSPKMTLKKNAPNLIVLPYSFFFMTDTFFFSFSV